MKRIILYLACAVLSVVKTIYVFPAIYDCFAFNNELELLNIRLHELYVHVDKFVIVEWTQTHRGNPKPLYFKENFEQFAQFQDKIVHIVLENPIETADPWVRENFQRNSIMLGLRHCQPNDIILISDADELIRGEAIPKIVELLHNYRRPAVVCEQTMYRFYLNARDSCRWAGTVACTYDRLKRTTPTDLRLNRNNFGDTYYYPMVHNAGWHFTSMGGFQRFTQKIDSVAPHPGDNIMRYYQPKYVEDSLQQQCIKVPIDASYPKYIIENEQAFRDIGFIY